MQKQLLKNKKLIVCLIFFVATISLVSFWIYSHKPTELSVDMDAESGEYIDNLPVFRTSATTIINTSILNELVGDADYVFVAKVVTQEGYEYKFPVQIETADGGTKVVSDPYTNYRVRILENIKGELITDTDIPIQKKGGLYEDGSAYAVFEADELPVVGGTYIFYAYAQDDGSLLIVGPNSNEKLIIPRSARSSDVTDIVETSEEVREVEEAFKSQIIREGRGEFGVSKYEK